MNEINIADLIPQGKGNAITRQQLVKITGLTDREVRKEISLARFNEPILSTEKGYYKPDTWVEVERWIAQEQARAKSIFRSMRGAREYLKNNADKMLEVSNG